METKLCYKCKEARPHSQFSRSKREQDGLQQKCKACDRKYRQVHSEHIKVWQSDYRGKHRDRAKEYHKEWISKNREHVREYSRMRKKTHPEESNKYTIIRRNRIRERTVESFTRADVFETWEGICHICEQPVDPDNRETDHVIPVALRGEHSLENVRVSHPECNQAKGTNLLTPELRTNIVKASAVV